MTNTPLISHTGAEITGIDLRDTRDADTTVQVKKAFASHHVLAFRGLFPAMH
ncbi:hypothetical protein [Candidimonas nitroreducens]|uniref:hypothetical protein n=1 Tax=Candidimonas nitroreducens TaxID=683354 RepID=UPI001302F4A7|nr:hypothetical protein [Candidimonas nitroreducens]